jgi:hypothetical protein
MDDCASQEEVIRQVLEAYRKTPGTMGTVRRPDRVVDLQLYQRGISVSVIENAFVLRRRAATEIESLYGLFPAGDRGSAWLARQPRLLPISPPQTRGFAPTR